MKLCLKMTLETDTIFGNGLSVPGGEDSSVLSDGEGFPYYKGGTFKGIFREELENLMVWQPDLEIDVKKKLGYSGDDSVGEEKIRFTDFVISPKVKYKVLECVKDPRDVLDAFTCLRTFTAIDDENGVVARGSLRTCRCIKSGITFYSTMICEKEDIDWVKEVLGLIKWVGTMRNRGFGKVKIEMI